MPSSVLEVLQSMGATTGTNMFIVCQQLDAIEERVRHHTEADELSALQQTRNEALLAMKGALSSQVTLVKMAVKQLGEAVVGLNKLIAAKSQLQSPALTIPEPLPTPEPLGSKMTPPEIRPSPGQTPPVLSGSKPTDGPGLPIPQSPGSRLPGSKPVAPQTVGTQPSGPSSSPPRRPKPRIERQNQPPEQQVMEAVRELKPLDWKDKDVKLNTSALHQSLIDDYRSAYAESVPPVQPPARLIFEIGSKLAIGSRYAPSMMGPGGGDQFAPLSFEELQDPQTKDKIDTLGQMAQSLSEVLAIESLRKDPETGENISPAQRKQYLWEAAEALWKRDIVDDRPSGWNEFGTSFKFNSRAFETAYKEQGIKPLKLSKGIDPEFEKRIGDTQTALGNAPVAVCMTDADRTILFNEDDFKTESGNPDYDKAEAVLIHESHHAMSKGFVNGEIFGEELHQENWTFDEIITDYFAKQAWDKKYPSRKDEYFKYTSYFKDHKQDPSGAGWYGHHAGGLFSAVGGEAVIKKAYFGGDRESVQKILSAKDALLPLIRAAE